MSSLIMHVDIDAFFASVEQLRNPALRGRPVIVGAGVIASCSYEAKRRGLRAGMPLYEALRVCPSAVVMDGHAQIYRCFAERVFEICGEIAPGVETHLDEAYCDLTGTDDVYGSPLAVGKKLRDEVKQRVGLSVSVGLAVNRMIAKMAGKTVKPGGVRLIEPGREREFVSGMPVGELPGVGRATREVLRKLNVRTGAELAAVPREYLRVLFGRNGDLLYRRCRGLDTGLMEHEIPKSISRETSFRPETGNRREIEGTVHYLAGRAARTLRSLGLSCRTVKVKVHYADGGSRGVARTLPTPVRLDGEIFRAAVALLGPLLARRSALRLAGLSLSSLCGAPAAQGELYRACLSSDAAARAGRAMGGTGGGDGSAARPERASRAAGGEARPSRDGASRAAGGEARPSRDGASRAAGGAFCGAGAALHAADGPFREADLYRGLDRVRDRFGHGAVVSGRSLYLTGKVKRDRYGYILRTPSLTK